MLSHPRSPQSEEVVHRCETNNKYKSHPIKNKSHPKLKEFAWWKLKKYGFTKVVNLTKLTDITAGFKTQLRETIDLPEYTQVFSHIPFSKTSYQTIAE